MRRTPLLLGLAALALIVVAIQHELNHPELPPSVAPGKPAAGPSLPELPAGRGPDTPRPERDGTPKGPATPTRESLSGETTLLKPSAEPREMFGRVVDDRGAPLPGVMATLKRADDPLGVHALAIVEDQTDGEGRFRLSDPTGGPGRVVFTRNGWSPMVVAIDGPRGSVNMEDVTLQRGVLLRGSVRDHGTDRPIAGAQVSIDFDSQFAGAIWTGAVPPGSAVTDADGHFTIADLSRTQYRIRVDREGFATASLPRSFLAVTAEPTANIEVLLYATDQTMSGQVFSQDDGDEPRPIGGAIITARPADPKVVHESSTLAGSDGRFEFRELTRGSYLLTAAAPGYFPTDPTRANAGETDVRVFVEGAGRLRGLVQSSLGAPTPAAYLQLYRLEGTFRRPKLLKALTLDESAQFSCDDLAPGTYQLCARDGDNAETWSSDILVAIGATIDHTLTMSAGGMIEGRVMTDENAPRSGVLVALCKPDFDPTAAMASPFALAGLQERRAITTSDGSFRIKHVAEGEYGLYLVAKNGDRDVIRGITVTDGSSFVVDNFSLGGGGQIGGVARNTDGRPLRQVRIVATAIEGAAADGATTKFVSTDDDGTFRFVGLSPGEWRIELGRTPAIDPKRFEAIRFAIVERGKETIINLDLRDKGGP